MNDTTWTIDELQEEVAMARSKLGRIRHIMCHAAIDDEEGDTEALRVALGKIAALVGVDWVP
jgi:hypothetical protein